MSDPTLSPALIPDPTPLVNNPRRVAPEIERAEGGPDRQAGIVRAVIVAGLAGDPQAGPQVLGSFLATQQEAAMIASSSFADDTDVARVETSGIYLDQDGNLFQLREGDALPAGYTRQADVLESRLDSDPIVIAGVEESADGFAIGVPVGLDDAQAQELYDEFVASFRAQYPGLRTPEGGTPPAQTPEDPAPPATTPEDGPAGETTAQRNRRLKREADEAAAAEAADEAARAEREAQG